MTLIETIKQLQEMEQQMTPRKWESYSGIVRSKLPQHLHAEIENVNIITECTPIAELDRLQFGTTNHNSRQDAKGIARLRNAAPAMLDVLCRFLPGDADILDSAIIAVEMIPCIEEGDVESKAKILAGLKRIQEAARRMEECTMI